MRDAADGVLQRVRDAIAADKALAAAVTEVDQVARNLASQLLVLATGAEIEFADRDSVERIVDHGRAAGHPVRAMIHQVVRNDLFRRQ